MSIYNYNYWNLKSLLIRRCGISIGGLCQLKSPCSDPILDTQAGRDTQQCFIMVPIKTACRRMIGEVL